MNLNSNDYGSDVHGELRVVREDLREYNKTEKLRLLLRRNRMDFLVKMDIFASEFEGVQVCDDGGGGGGGGGQLRDRKKSSTVVYHPDCEKVIWQDLISAAKEVFPACEHRMCA
ncbi:hypothetical protein H5410_027664 [Solanum commersonii]|uniref:Uncharacterized protein n=1 Tax=Solanum commersonii TaxID=4109 RepID=A0A9J5Z406_SOLCO|nr:hypothetical protein H5410_027664 [Solanum commersonii]